MFLKKFGLVGFLMLGLWGWTEYRFTEYLTCAKYETYQEKLIKRIEEKIEDETDHVKELIDPNYFRKYRKRKR